METEEQEEEADYDDDGHAVVIPERSSCGRSPRGDTVPHERGHAGADIRHGAKPPAGQEPTPRCAAAEGAPDAPGDTLGAGWDHDIEFPDSGGGGGRRVVGRRWAGGASGGVGGGNVVVVRRGVGGRRHPAGDALRRRDVRGGYDEDGPRRALEDEGREVGRVQRRRRTSGDGERFAGGARGEDGRGGGGDETTTMIDEYIDDDQR